MGARNASALITLNERTSRTQIVLDLPHGYRAELTIERLGDWTATMPRNVLKSITWNRRSEMAQWETLAMHWGVDVYFADAHSPRQRARTSTATASCATGCPRAPTYAATPKAVVDHAICNVLNTQPRKSLHWKAPNTVYADHAAR